MQWEYQMHARVEEVRWLDPMDAPPPVDTRAGALLILEVAKRCVRNPVYKAAIALAARDLGGDAAVGVARVDVPSSDSQAHADH